MIELIVEDTHGRRVSYDSRRRKWDGPEDLVSVGRVAYADVTGPFGGYSPNILLGVGGKMVEIMGGGRVVKAPKTANEPGAVY